ncbi:MAG TPA: Uma2 family endonuclease [Labilithrix sp.]|nr:Uma2 family endonuclease [Labilithrix sp.]
MSGQPWSQPYVRFEDFLADEQRADVKHEWLDGVVYAMAGGTIEHGRLATKMTAALTVAGQCTVYSSDVMLYVRETNLATYPDGSVVCGPVDVQRVVRNGKVLGEAMTNPTLVVEVLSRDSTEGYDRGEKFSHYMRMPSLEEYVLVAQDERRIEVYRRPQGRGHWQCEVARQGETVTMHGQLFRVDDVYDE